MLRAGLTGGLGSGKTTVSGFFHALGAHIISADTLGSKLMAPGHAAYNAIVEHFGPTVVRPDGTLDRPLLADLAFRRNRLAELNLLVHPPVIEAQQKLADDIFAKDPDAVVIVESALIFEADRQGSAPGWRKRFDRIILVTAPVEVRVRRYVEHISRLSDRFPNMPPPSPADLAADARNRIAVQIPDEEKIPLADYVIHNDGSLEITRREVERIFVELVRASRIPAQSR